MTTSMAPTMRLRLRPRYAALALAAMQRAIAYRWTTLFNLAANLIWVTVLYYFWRTIFAANPQVGTFSWLEMRTYILVAYAINALLSFSTASRMMATIRTGEIVTELVRPLDYLSAQLVQVSSAALLEGFVSSSITVVLGVFVLGIAPPISLPAAGFFLVSMCIGFVIKFLINFMVALLCFWTLSGTGLLWAQAAVINTLSGAQIPLYLFPSWLRVIALITPLQAIVHTPLIIYLGKVQGAELAQALLIQIAWLVVLWVAARFLWLRSIRSLKVQGG